jgi:hypothetical protein
MSIKPDVPGVYVLTLTATSNAGTPVVATKTWTVTANSTVVYQGNLVGTNVLTGISLGAGSGQTMAVARVDETYNFGVRISTGSASAASQGTRVNLKYTQVPAGDTSGITSAATGSLISPVLTAVDGTTSTVKVIATAATSSVPAYLAVGSALALGTSNTVNETIGTATFLPKVVGTYKIFAWADTASTGNAIGSYQNGERTSTLSVIVGGAPATISITAAASTAAANASGTAFAAGSGGTGSADGALFVITLTDAAGNPTRPTTGETINLSTTLGTLSDVTLSSGDFNASGVAAVNLQHTAAGSAVVTATSGGAMPTLTSKTASVSFVLADTLGTADIALFTDTTGLSSAAAITENWGSETARTFAEGKASATLKVYGTVAAQVVSVRIYDHSGSITGYAGGAYSVPVTIGTGSTGSVAIPLSALVEDDSVYVSVNSTNDDTALLTAAVVAIDGTNSSISPATSAIGIGGGITLTAYAKDQFGQAVPGAAISWSVAGRNATTIPSVALMSSLGTATYTLTDISTSSTSLTDTISAAITYDGVTITETSVLSYATANAVSTITASTTPTLTVATTESAISTAATGAAGGAVTLGFTVKDAAGVILVGVPVTFTSSLTESGFGSSATDTVVRTLAYTGSDGVATTYVYGWKSPSTTTVTATAGGKTATTTINFVNAATDARTITLTAAGAIATATVKDRYGNPVKGVTVDWSRTGTGYFGSGTSATTGTTDANGVAEIVVVGSATVKASLSVTTYAQTDDLSGYVGATATSGVGSTLAPAGIGSATVAVDAGVTAAETAADAAAEATDAANAATDAANAAAEAADAATAAAQDAADAVAALSAQVATLVASIKSQITALTALIVKIQKKVKA